VSPEPPSYPTLIGGLIVLAGTLVVLVSLLPGYDLPGWREKASAYGALIIGIGTALSFLGGALHPDRSEYDVLSWGLLALAVLLIATVSAPYITARLRLAKRNRERKKRNKTPDTEDAEDHLSIYVLACERHVDGQRDDEGAGRNEVRGEPSSSFREPHKTVRESHPVADIPPMSADCEG